MLLRPLFFPDVTRCRLVVGYWCFETAYRCHLQSSNNPNFLSPWTLKMAPISFSTAKQLPVGQVLLFIEASRSHSDTPNSVGLLCSSDQSVAETSTWQHTTLTRDRHSRPRWDSNPQSQKASSRSSTPFIARPLESVTDMLARNVGNHLPAYAA